jgi:hypothetical protein
MSATELKKLKKEELKDELTSRGLQPSSKDTKADMIEKILAHDARMAEAGKKTIVNKSSSQLTQELKALGLSGVGTFEAKSKRLAEHQVRESSMAKPSPGKKSPARSEIFTFDQNEEYTVASLKDMLKDLSLSTTGNKEALTKRLADYYKDKVEFKTLHNILLINKDKFTGKAKRGGEYPHAVKIALNDKMFQKFSIPPVEHDTSKGKKCSGKTIVFGPLLDIDMYALHGTVTGNDMAIINYEDVSSYDGKELYQMVFPLDEEVEVYAHHDRFGEIDSLILEQKCLFL